MPELPEVETVRRGLAPVMAARRIARVELRRPDLRFPLPDGFAARLEGRRIEALDRRAKYLLAHLDSGETLIMHLGMSGRFSVAAPGVAPTDVDMGVYYAQPGNPVHDHVVFEMAEEGGLARLKVVYNDPRRFGFMDLAATGALDASRHFARMGPEPLSSAFDAAYLVSALSGRRTPLKAALLDQAVVGGLGNIYVCEALYRARLSPRRLAHTVGTARAARIVNAVRAVLEEAISAGGSTLRDFAAADGALGYFQHRFEVYDREGKPCPSCGATVARYVQSGRSTFACGRCQK